MSIDARPSVPDRYRAVIDRAAELRAAQEGVRRRRALTIVRYGDVVTLAAALWLTCAPYALGYTGTGRLDGFWSDALAGAVLGIAALVRLSDPDGALAVRVGSVLVAGWLTAAPFTLGYSGGAAPKATVNEVAVGALVVLVTLLGLRALAVSRPTPRGAVPTG